MFIFNNERMRPQLFLLHFAGGSIYSFDFMRNYLPGIDFSPLELPGRGKRLSEPLLLDLEKAVEDTCTMLLRQLRSDIFIIYGHSLGALLALKVTGLLENKGIAPRALVITGYSGPSPGSARNRHLMSDDQFIDALRELGGVPEEILENKPLFSFFAPILKADFGLAEKCDHTTFNPIRTPIYAIMGNREEGSKAINNLENYALTSFTSEIWEGDHFFIRDQPARIASMIKKIFLHYINIA